MVFLKSFKFDKKGRKIFESDRTINFKSSFDNEKEFIYENDELKKIIIKSAGKEYIVELTYKYDSFGNWTQQTKSVNGKKLFIWSREIEYY
jgi:seryl-tRNA(Sec) selenium transferase